MKWATWTGRHRMVVALPVLCVFGVASVTFVQHRDSRPSPVFEVMPTSAPASAAVLRGTGSSETCVSSDGLGHPPRSGRTWVDPRPSGGKALWLPGFNARDCRAVLTRLSTRQAQALASAVEGSSPFPAGAHSCPMDDESSVTAFLTYPGHDEAEVVRVLLSGCGGVTAPGRDIRTRDTGVIAALKPLPDGWR
jgi:hypothetical protein